jgi:hypothetical protein
VDDDGRMSVIDFALRTSSFLILVKNLESTLYIKSGFFVISFFLSEIFDSLEAVLFLVISSLSKFIQLKVVKLNVARMTPVTIILFFISDTF